jgi:hypothetical protein
MRTGKKLLFLAIGRDQIKYDASLGNRESAFRSLALRKEIYLHMVSTGDGNEPESGASRAQMTAY